MERGKEKREREKDRERVKEGEIGVERNTREEIVSRVNVSLS